MKITDHFDRLPESVKKVVYEKNGNTAALPEGLKAGIEKLSGLSMDDVRVHYNSQKPVQMQAESYAYGNDIHIAPGQEKHIAHEAWHIVQQKQGRVKPTMGRDGIDIADDPKLDCEADVMGAKALIIGTTRI